MNVRSIRCIFIVFLQGGNRQGSQLRKICRKEVHKMRQSQDHRLPLKWWNRLFYFIYILEGKLVGGSRGKGGLENV